MTHRMTNFMRANTQSLYRHTVWLCALATAGLAVFGGLSFAMGKWSTVTLAAGYVAMAPLTALLFVLASTALILLRYRHDWWIGRHASVLWIVALGAEIYAFDYPLAVSTVALLRTSTN